MMVDFKLYLITDRKKIPMPLPQAVRLALEGGVQAIQLREKDLPTRDLLALAQELRKLTREFGAKLIVNDRVDIAVAVDADGVHLGHASMPAEPVRGMLGKDKLLGVSTHNLEEAQEAAQAGADFITFGPIFETPSKAGMGVPVGTDAIRAVKQYVDIPIFGLGGIHGRNMGHVFWSGAFGVGMISAIFGAEDIRKRAASIMGMILMIDHAVCNQCGRRD